MKNVLASSRHRSRVAFVYDNRPTQDMCRQACAETARVDDQGTSVPSLTQRPSSRAKRRGGGAVFLLPTHLLVCPVPAEAPKSGRARSRWAAERSAWKMTEWLVSFYNYFEMGCCKTFCEYQDLLGSWHVSAGQSSAAHGLFRRLAPFCQNRASSDWTRGRKSLFEALKALGISGVKGGDSTKVFDVLPQAVDPSRVSLPKTAGTCDPGDYLCGGRAKVFADLKQLVKDEDEWDTYAAPPSLSLRLSS